MSNVKRGVAVASYICSLLIAGAMLAMSLSILFNPTLSGTYDALGSPGILNYYRGMALLACVIVIVDAYFLWKMTGRNK